MRRKALFFTIAVLLAPVVSAETGPWIEFSGKPAFQVSPRGKVWPVVWWIEDRAHDPKSLEWLYWSPLMSNGAKLGVTVRYRARNAFGALVLEDRVFFLDRSGRVLGHD